MAVNLEDIQLSQEQKRLVAEQANKNGQPWQSVLQEVLDSNGVTDDESLDSAFMDWCAEQVRGKEIISLDEAHRILSTCSGSWFHLSAFMPKKIPKNHPPTPRVKNVASSAPPLIFACVGVPPLLSLRQPAEDPLAPCPIFRDHLKESS